MATQAMLRAATRQAPGLAVRSARSKSTSQLSKVLDTVDPEATRRLIDRVQVLGRGYWRYAKFAGGAGWAYGLAFAGAHIADIADERPVSRKEYVGYPLLGSIGGAFVGLTAPAWLILAPVGYVVGYDAAAAIVRVLLAGALRSDTGSD